MRILIIGGSGMLGHQLWRQLHARHETWVTLRRPAAFFKSSGLFEADRVIQDFDAANTASLLAAFAKAKPEVVINCAAVLNKTNDQEAALQALRINGVLPHELARFCALVNARFIHISTDGVFSGKKGNYQETDVADATDLYGKTKSLGEVIAPHCLVVRTCIIGRELGECKSLLEWFLGQEGQTIKGFKHAIFTGFTTLALARILEEIIVRWPELSGLYHIAGDPISKFDLLCYAKRAFKWNGTIHPEESLQCNRSLDSGKFTMRTGFVAPSWEEMLAELSAVTGKQDLRSV